MFRQSAMRLSAPIVAAQRAAVRPRAIKVPQSNLSRASVLRRTYATEIPPTQPSGGNGAGAASHAPMLLVLAAILGVGGAGYWYMKPVRDVAALAKGGVESVKENSASLNEIAGYAKSVLPPGVFAVYSHLASQPGGINGFLSHLKDKDLRDMLEELKKVGGDDVKRIVEKVQKKVDAAQGKVENIDWKSLVSDLKSELPEGSQNMVDMLIGKVPDKGDIDALIKKAKEVGGDQLKQVEASAKKVWEKVEAAKKEGKGQADALLSGLKETAPADVDSLIKQLKEAASKAGLPADTTEAWLKSKVNDGKVDVDALGKQVEGQLKTASKFLPGEPKDLVNQVEQVSPSLAKLLSQALQQAGITDEKGNKKI